MSEEQEWLIVNDVCVEEATIFVGATNRKRWLWETERGQTGSDAKTIVWVSLQDNGPGYVVSEEAGLNCGRSDPLRQLALQGIGRLLEVAWKIKEECLDGQQAKEAFFGYEIQE